MVKTLIACIIITLNITYTHAQTNWRPLKADNRVVLQFPSEPKELNGNFVATDNENVTYTFKCVNIQQVYGIDSTILAHIKNTSFFTGRLKARIQKNLPGISLNSMVIGNWKGFTSYTSSGNYAGKKYNVFMFIIGDRLYGLSTLTPASASSSGRDKFFASASLTK